MNKFGIAFVPNNFDYEQLDNKELNFRDLKIILLAGPFNTIKEASDSMESFYSDKKKFGYEKMIISYNSETMQEIDF